MKMVYEKPTAEFISFEIKEDVMNEQENELALAEEDPTLGFSDYVTPPF